PVPERDVRLVGEHAAVQRQSADAIRRVLHPRRPAGDSELATEGGGGHSADARGVAAGPARAARSVFAISPPLDVRGVLRGVECLYVARDAVDFLVFLSRAGAVWPEDCWPTARDGDDRLTDCYAAGA